MTSLLEKDHDLNPSHLKMIEDVLDEHVEFETKNDLLRALPTSISSEEFDKIINYLEASKKIMYDEKNMIVWLCNNDPKFKKILDGAHKL